MGDMLSGANLIYTIEGMTFLAILLLLLYFCFALNLFKKD